VTDIAIADGGKLCAFFDEPFIEIEQRRIGAGIWPLMPVAVIGRPLTLIGTGPISSWKSVPLRTGARPGAATARRRGKGTSDSAPAAAAPCRRRRRVRARRKTKGFIVRLQPARSP
jgi:hypothetical protein